MTKTILLNQRPEGLPKLSDFKLTEETLADLQNGELLLQTKYVSVDPYLRGRMNDVKSYIPPFELHKPLASITVAQVVDSKNQDYKKGEFVCGILQWKEMQISDGNGLMIVDPNQASLSAYLGVLGMTGLTAYFGMTEIGKPKKGETLLVSGAAGAVGSIAGQIGRLSGMRVVGIAGSDEKVAMLKNKFQFDEAINYKTSNTMVEAIQTACPNGVDVYFDNVGGSISDAVLFTINDFARIVQCGAISIYNETKLPKSIPVHTFLIRKRALMQGFIVFDYKEKYPQAIHEMSQWLKNGKLTYSESIVAGFDQIPQAFIDLFHGKNKGKMVVKV